MSIVKKKTNYRPHFYSYPSCHHDDSRSPTGYENPINNNKIFLAYGSDNSSELICSGLIHCGGFTGTTIEGIRATNLFLAAVADGVSIYTTLFPPRSDIPHEIFRRQPPTGHGNTPVAPLYALRSGTISLAHHQHASLHTTSPASRRSSRRHPPTQRYPGSHTCQFL